MTKQVVDHIIFNGERFILAERKGDDLEIPKEIKLQPYPWSTASYRGFFCDYSIENETLYMTSLSIGTKDGIYPTIENVEPTMHELCGIAQYHDLQIHIPFCGGMLIGRDYIWGYGSDFPIAWVHKSVFEIEFSDGKVTNIIDRSKSMNCLRFFNRWFDPLCLLTSYETSRKITKLLAKQFNIVGYHLD